MSDKSRTLLTWSTDENLEKKLYRHLDESPMKVNNKRLAQFCKNAVPYWKLLITTFSKHTFDIDCEITISGLDCTFITPKIRLNVKNSNEIIMSFKMETNYIGVFVISMLYGQLGFSNHALDDESNLVVIGDKSLMEKIASMGN